MSISSSPQMYVYMHVFICVFILKRKKEKKNQARQSSAEEASWNYRMFFPQKNSDTTSTGIRAKAEPVAWMAIHVTTKTLNHKHP